MSAPDLVLLHPPALFDFREQPRQHWLISKHVDVTPAYDYYPLGFVTIMDYLERHGLQVRIANLAVKMTKRRRFDPRRFVRGLQPAAFGVDLHWMVHVDGALALAQLVKEEHPQTPVLLGGLSASFFHRELIALPYVDYVVRGDSTEPVVLELVRAIEAGREPADIPNLTWKRGGEVVVNPLSYQPTLLDVRFNWRRVLSHLLRYRDLYGHLLTGQKWFNYCVNVFTTCRGCRYRCVFCGGSNWALGRRELALFDLEALAEDLAVARNSSPFPIRLEGDIRQQDWRAVLEALRRHGVNRKLHFDLFSTASKEFVQAIAEVVAPPAGTLNVLSHDPAVRAASGVCMSPEGIEQTVEHFLGAGGTMSLFFYVGLPTQTAESARQTTRYALELMERFHQRYPRKLDVCVAPLAPFLDPGSPAFCYPHAYDYRLRARTAAEHRELMRSQHWVDTLNYESEHISRQEIAEVSVWADEQVVAAMKADGRLPARQAADQLRRLAQDRAALPPRSGAPEGG